MSRAFYVLVVAAVLALIGVLITSHIDQTQVDLPSTETSEP